MVQTSHITIKYRKKNKLRNYYNISKIKETTQSLFYSHKFNRLFLYSFARSLTSCSYTSLYKNPTGIYKSVSRGLHSKLMKYSFPLSTVKYKMSVFCISM